MMMIGGVPKGRGFRAGGRDAGTGSGGQWSGDGVICIPTASSLKRLTTLQACTDSFDRLFSRISSPSELRPAHISLDW